MAKDMLSNRLRNLGCFAIMVVVLVFFIIATAGFLQRAYYVHPKRITEAHDLTALRAKKLARRISGFVEVGDLAGAGAALKQALEKNGWLYVELNLRPSSMPAESSPPATAANASEISRAGVAENGSITAAPTAKEDKAPEDLPLVNALSYGNASVLPPSNEERLAAWNAVLRTPSFRSSHDINQRKILTVSVLVRKLKRSRLPLHGFLLVRREYRKTK
ncbi:MAG: hypothetical protein E3J72_06310 [Planctomycetota bacterium]|nr:MAG: hypothetical protein E3J72_06310 [Planctomycetota bacterium]